jgi:uncharacterized repeat protein (TIGR04076 family)
MYELKVTVKKVMGTCTATPPMKPGDYFTVSDGDIQVPDGGYICLYALQSLIPVITPKERRITEHEDEDWMWRVHHAQCPDPAGRVVFKIERTGKVPERRPAAPESRLPPRRICPDSTGPSHADLKRLRITVEEVRGHCTSRMNPGDEFELCSGRLYLPPGGHACLYALHAAMPLLPAKQRSIQDGDWLKEDHRVLCPDPAGNVILRIDRME